MPGLVVVTLMVCSGAGVTWIRYHGSQDWHDYFEYNAARVQIHDTARRFHLNEDAVLESTGWSRNDARMFANWYFPDRETFSIESVKAAVDSSSGHTGFGDAVSLSWRTQYKRLVVAAAASIVVTALVLSKGRSRLALAGLTGWMLSVSLALATIRKLPARVALAFVFLVAFAAIIQQRPTLAVRRSVSRWVLAITAFIGLLTAVDILAGQSRIRDHHADFRSVAAGMSDATSAGDLVVAWAGAYRGHWVDPRSSGDSLPVDLLPMGWQTFSPPWVELAASHGISDVTSSISTDPSVYLAVDRTAVVDDKSFERFASEHLGIEGRLRPVARLGRDGSIELADIEVQVTVDYDRQQIVEAGLDGSETRRSLTEAPASAWMLSENRWPYDILGWVDTQTAGPVVDPSEWDLSTPGSILPPVTPGRGDVWAAVLYDGRVSDLELAVPDPDVPGRWWFDARVRGGEPGLWSVYLLNGDSAHPVTELPAAQQ